MLNIIDVNTFYPRPEFSFNFGILSQGAIGVMKFEEKLYRYIYYMNTVFDVLFVL